MRKKSSRNREINIKKENINLILKEPIITKS